MSSVSNDEERGPECTCKKIRELCDDLITEAFQRFVLCPIFTLPNIAIDFYKCDESVDAYLEVFQKGSYIVWKDIGRCAPQELEKSMIFMTEAEMRLNEEMNKDVIMNGNDENGRPLSKDSDTSRITKEFMFIQKIATIFKIHGKGTHMGRMVRNCPVSLTKGELTVITIDKRYQYCSTREIMYITNLRHFLRKLVPGVIVQIGDTVTLKILKQIDKHITCCVQLGGVVKSYMSVFIPDCDPITLPCLSDTDRRDCNAALKYKATAIVIPHPHTACYVNQIRKYFCEYDDQCRINILVEFDEEVFLCEDSCQRIKTIQSIEASNGIFLSKPILTLTQEITSFVKDKIIVSKYLSKVPSEYYYGINTLLPTCFLLTRNRETFTSQFTSLTSMINSIHRSVTDECQCSIKEHENTKALISITSSGEKAIEISRARKNYPIVAITDDPLTTRELHLYKGVKPIYFDWKILENRSDKSTLKYLLRLSVAYARHLCLLYEKFCIKQYELVTECEQSQEESYTNDNSNVSSCSSVWNCNGNAFI